MCTTESKAATRFCAPSAGKPFASGAKGFRILTLVSATVRVKPRLPRWRPRRSRGSNSLNQQQRSPLAPSLVMSFGCSKTESNRRCGLILSTSSRTPVPCTISSLATSPQTPSCRESWRSLRKSTNRKNGTNSQPRENRVSLKGKTTRRKKGSTKGCEFKVSILNHRDSR